jgi:hypothetical protein
MIFRAMLKLINLNAVVIPVLQTFNVLLEARVLEQLSQHSDGLNRSGFFVNVWFGMVLTYILG